MGVPSGVFEELVNALPFGLYLVDANQRIQFWNRSAEAITGYLRHEALGRRCSELLAHCDGDGKLCCTSSTCPLHSSAGMGISTEARVFSRHKDGYRTAVLIRCIPIRDEDGAIIGVAELFQQHHANGEISWTDGPGFAHSGITLPSPAEMEEYLRSVLADSRSATGVFLIEIEQLQALVKYRGAEVVRAAQRIVVRTLMQILTIPNQLGLWSDRRFLLVLPECDEYRFTEVERKLAKVGGRCELTWWGDHVPLLLSVKGKLVGDEDSADELLQSLGAARTDLAELGRD